MNITLTLSPEQKTQLEDSLQRKDRKRVHQILRAAIDPTIDRLIKIEGRMSILEFERLANELANQVETATGGQTPLLRDEDINRTGIYL